MATGQRGKAAVFLVAGTGLLLSACLQSGRPALLADRMWLHFQDAGAVQTAVIVGDLDRARQAARRLAAEGEVSGVPAGAEVELDAFRASARAVAAAQTLDEAIAATSQMAVSCGSCHALQGTGPVFSEISGEPDFGNAGHMVEHIWAADRLWEGLVQPTSNGWEAGARVLAEHEIPMGELASGTSSLAVDLKSLGVDAMTDRGPDARAARYTQILSTCASCHMRSAGQ